jgi:hypothetical protein
MQKKSSSLAKFAKVSLGLAACAAVTVTAYAAWTIDDDGFGFIGKGDVQTACGLKNNAALQQLVVNHLESGGELILFRLEETSSASWICEDDPDQAGSGDRRDQNKTRTQEIAGAPNGDPRKKAGQQQFTGFDLNGWAGDPEEVIDGAPYIGFCDNSRRLKEGSLVFGASTGGFQVSCNGGEDWHDLQ